MCTPPASGSIYTVDDEDSTVDCMLVENSEILAIGSVGIPDFLSLPYIDHLSVAISEQIRKYWNTYKPNVSLEMFQTPPGSIIIPGLAGMAQSVYHLHDVILLNLRSLDAHGHILEWGVRSQLPLEGCASIDGTVLHSI